jgi:hypothetical protein
MPCPPGCGGTAYILFWTLDTVCRLQMTILSPVYLAYSMMALLYETVRPAFEDTWIECLADLGLYRTVIEEDDIRDRSLNIRWWYPI